jgi:hypothetical protein
MKGTVTYTTLGYIGRNLRQSWVFSATLLACASSMLLPHASAAISIGFSGSSTTAMGSAEIAGVVAKSKWNNAGGASSVSALKLVDDTGAATNVTVSWTSNNPWNTPISDLAGNSRMMRGYLDNGNGNPTNVNVSGLTSGKYNIYVYTDGDNSGQTHTGIYQMSGSGITTTSISAIDAPNTNFNGTFVQANNSTGNYVMFSGVSVSSGFTLTATPGTTDGSPRAPVNGIQIIPVSSPDFTVTATPSSRTVIAGTFTNYTVTVSALNGFAGTVNLSASGLPVGTTASFSPAAITGSGSSILTVTTIGSTPAGTSSLTFKGTSGSVIHSASATLAVSSALPAAISVNFAGSSTTLMASSEKTGVAAKGYWNNASGATSSSPLTLVSETGLATGASMTWTSDNTWNTSVSDVAGNNRMMRGYLDNGSGNPVTLNVSGVIPGKYTIYVYTDGDNSGQTHTGIYQISGSGITTTSISATDAPNTNFNGTFVQANNSTGNYVMFSGVSISSGFTLTATAGATDGSPRAPVNGIQIVPAVPDFSISATPGAQTVVAGGKVSWTVAVGALNGFSAPVSLSASGLPLGASISFSAPSVTGSGSLTATVTTGSTMAGSTSTLTINGISGSLSHTATAPLTVAVNQPPTVSAGSNQTVTMPAAAQLSGTATNNRVPNGTMTYLWKMVSGPGTVTFGNAQALSTTASFSSAGAYVLSLTVSDGVLSSSAQCTITVNAGISGYFVSVTNGNDSWSGQLPSPNATNTDGPFQTLARAQRAMQGSTIKIVYIRAGHYFPSPATSGDGCLWGANASINLISADSGETWSYYPPDGYNSAIIDGGAPAVPQTGQGSNTMGTGTGCAFADDYASNVTITGLQFQNYRFSALSTNGIPLTSTGISGITNINFTNNIVHDMRIAAFGADAVSLTCAPNSTVANNYIYNVAYAGIGFGNVACPGGMSNDVISGNVIINSCTWAAYPGGDQDGGDCGAIYGNGTGSTNIQIVNNYIRDINVSSNGTGDFGACCTIGIYMDAASNITASGNVITGIHSACFQMHGDNNHTNGNICDEGPVGPRFIVSYFTTDTGNSIYGTGNTFEDNIVVGGSNGGGYVGQTLAGTPTPLSIQNNAYFNYAGTAMNTGGGTSAGNDSNPVYENPGISCWAPGVASGSPVFNTPVKFPGIKGGWGPPGFVIPQNGTQPSWPHGC